MIQSFEVDATDLEGQVVEVRTHVTAGEHLLSATYLKIYHGLPPSYHGPEPSKRPPEPLLIYDARGKLTEKDIETLRKYGTKIKTDRIETRVGQPVRIDRRRRALSRKRPEPSAESLRKVYVCGHAPGKHNDACARHIVANFAGRAFRRPATAKEVDSFLTFRDWPQSRATLSRKASPRRWRRCWCRRNSCTASSRIGPRARDGPPAPLSDYELASRLSYFLWSSMPDDELLRAGGRSGKLRQPAVLDAQVRRMLRGPEVRGAGREFRRAVAAVPEHRRRAAGRGTVSGFRREPAAVDAAGDGAVRRTT